MQYQPGVSTTKQQNNMFEFGLVWDELAASQENESKYQQLPLGPPGCHSRDS